LDIPPRREEYIGKPSRRWQDTVKLNFNEMECEGVNWIHLAHCRVQWRALVYTVMNLLVP